MSKKITKSQRRKLIWKKTKGCCAHCGRKASSFRQTIDHFIPKIYGGTYDYRNLMPLCYECNNKRGCNLINPYKFYKYAPEEAIRKCIEYKNELYF